MNTVYQPLDFFPLPEPRNKQVRSLEFADRAFSKDYKDIVIAAPTGIGKSGIGAAICIWAAQFRDRSRYEPGGYYLVTQKLLQDQLEDDFQHFLQEYQRSGCSLKSSIEYTCPKYTTCMAGARMKAPIHCRDRRAGCCSYLLQKQRFFTAPVAITNYPYFFTERSYVKELKPRRVLIADECHTLERQILGFVDIHITRESMEQWTPFLLPMPLLKDMDAFVEWLKENYTGAIENRLMALKEQMMANPKDIRLQREFSSVENHANKMVAAVKDMVANPDNWVFWQEDVKGFLETTAKPLSASNFSKFLVHDGAEKRVYMSAYPGPHKVFCRSLGLDPAKTARIDLNSTFDPANRPIHLLFCGSMGRKSIDDTSPRILRVIEKIVSAHAQEKGLIHTHSYKLAAIVYDYLSKTEHAKRLLYSKNAEERESSFRKHISTSEPTVLISPSMTEGFSLDDDLARWQVITKVPYPNLGDKQVQAKKALDPEWYTLQTISTIVQACGRIVRSDEDHGTTYILDSDFLLLFEKNPEFFPRWFTDAFVWR